MLMKAYGSHAALLLLEALHDNPNNSSEGDYIFRGFNNFRYKRPLKV